MGLDMGIVPANLQEVYYCYHRLHAAEDLKGDGKEQKSQAAEDMKSGLVAGFCGDRVYDSSCGWGRFLRWIYCFISCFDGGSLKQRNLKQALEKTHQKFIELQAGLEKSVKTIHDWMAKNGEKVTEGDVLVARHAITNWNEVRPFLSLVKKCAAKKDESIARLFDKVLGSGSPQGDHEVKNGKEQKAATELFRESEVVKKAALCQPIIDLENQLGAPMPFSALSILITTNNESELKEGHRKALETWVWHVQKHADHIYIDLFRKALVNFVRIAIGEKFFEVPEEERHARGIASRVTYAMDILRTFNTDKHPTSLSSFFAKKDPEHMRWRDSLEPGSKIEYSEGTLTVVEQIGNLGKKDDQNVYFAVKEKPDQLVWICFNRVMLGLKYQMHGKFCDEMAIREPILAGRATYVTVIRGCTIHEVDAQGRFILIDRLQTPLSGIQWKEKQSKEEGVLLEWLTKELSLLLKREGDMIPRYLTPKHIMLDKGGVMRFWKITDLVPWDFDMILKFAQDVANGNLAIYQRLVGTSGVADHKIARFYQEVLEANLKGEAFDAAGLASRRNFSERTIAKRAEEFAKAILELKAQCKKLVLDELKRRHIDLGPRYDLDQVVGTTLRRSLKGEMRTVGCIWPGTDRHVADQIIQEIVEGREKR